MQCGLDATLLVDVSFLSLFEQHTATMLLPHFERARELEMLHQGGEYPKPLISYKSKVFTTKSILSAQETIILQA